MTSMVPKAMKRLCVATVYHAAIVNGKPGKLPGQCGNYALEAHDRCHVHAPKHAPKGGV